MPFAADASFTATAHARAAPILQLSSDEQTVKNTACIAAVTGGISCRLRRAYMLGWDGMTGCGERVECNAMSVPCMSCQCNKFKLSPARKRSPQQKTRRVVVWGGGIFLMSTFLNCTRSGTKKVSNFTKHDFHSGAEGYHPPMTAKPSWLQQTPVPYLPPPPPPLPPPPPPLSNEPSRFEGKLKSRRADASGRLDRTA